MLHSYPLNKDLLHIIICEAYDIEQKASQIVYAGTLPGNKCYQALNEQDMYNTPYYITHTYCR